MRHTIAEHVAARITIPIAALLAYAPRRRRVSAVLLAKSTAGRIALLPLHAGGHWRIPGLLTRAKLSP